MKSNLLALTVLEVVEELITLLLSDRIFEGFREFFKFALTVLKLFIEDALGRVFLSFKE